MLSYSTWPITSTELSQNSVALKPILEIGKNAVCKIHLTFLTFTWQAQFKLGHSTNYQSLHQIKPHEPSGTAGARVNQTNNFNRRLLPKQTNYLKPKKYNYFATDNDLRPLFKRLQI